MTEETNLWYLKTMKPTDYYIPKCFICGTDLDCYIEGCCETHLCKKCFNENKDKMDNTK